jgi:hypothetical protein
MSQNQLNQPADAAAARPKRPVTVDYAVYALVARCVFSVLSALVAYGARPELSDALATANRDKNWTPDQLRHNLDDYLRATLITVLIMAFMVLVMAKFLRDGRSWARWLYLAFAVLLTGDIQHVLGFVQYHDVLLRLTTGLTGLAAVAALVLMFLPASNSYLRPARPAGGMFGSLFGPRSPRDRPAGDPVTEPEPPAAGPPAAVDNAPAAVDNAPAAVDDLPAAVDNVPAEVPGTQATAGSTPTARRQPRAKSRRQPAE